MKYIGNKTRLLDFISSSMKSEKIPFSGRFFDIFGGTGSVGNYFKKNGFEIISNDLMTYSFIIQLVLIKLNKIPSFKKIQIGDVKNVFQYLNNIQPIEGYAYDNYAPSGKYKRQYFSDANAKKIDAIREKIEKWKNDNLLSFDEYYYLLACLINSADFVSNISGTYGAYLKIWRSMALKPLLLKQLETYDNNKNNEVYQMDANTLIKNIDCDVLYIDPPYNERQYASYFHVLESIAVWDKQNLRGKTGQRNYENQKSLYCQKQFAKKAFFDLINNAHAKYIIVSYNNEGIIKREDIITMLNTKGSLKEYTTDYRRFRTEKDNDHRQYKKCDDKVVEHLYICKIKDSETN